MNQFSHAIQRFRSRRERYGGWQTDDAIARCDEFLLSPADTFSSCVKRITYQGRAELMEGAEHRFLAMAVAVNGDVVENERADLSLDGEVFSHHRAEEQVHLLGSSV